MRKWLAKIFICDHFRRATQTKSTLQGAPRPYLDFLSRKTKFASSCLPLIARAWTLTSHQLSKSRDVFCALEKKAIAIKTSKRLHYKSKLIIVFDKSKRHDRKKGKAMFTPDRSRLCAQCLVIREQSNSQCTRGRCFSIILFFAKWSEKKNENERQTSLSVNLSHSKTVSDSRECEIAAHKQSSVYVVKM